MTFDKLERLELHLNLHLNYFNVKITDLRRLKSLHIESVNTWLELDLPDLTRLSLALGPKENQSNSIQIASHLRSLHCNCFGDWMRKVASLEELAIQKLHRELIPGLFLDLTNLRKLNIYTIDSLEPLKDLFEQSKNCLVYCKGLKMSQRFIDNLETQTASKIDLISLQTPVLNLEFILLSQYYEVDSCLPFITKAVCSEIVLDGLSRFGLLERLPNLCRLIMNESIDETSLISFLKEFKLRELEINCQVSQRFLDDLPEISPNLSRLSFASVDDQAKCFKFAAQLKHLKGLTIHGQHLKLDTLKRIVSECDYLSFVHITLEAMRCYLSKKNEITIYYDKYQINSTYTKFKFCNLVF